MQRIHRNWPMVSAGLAGLLLVTMGAAQAADPTPAPWARWQGRLSLGVTAPAGRTDLALPNESNFKISRWSLLGDYYFADSLRERSHLGGFRATSGVIVGVGSPFWAGQASLTASRGLLGVERQFSRSLSAPLAAPDHATEPTAVPYFGVGYTGLSARSRWSFSADLGMVARSPGQALKLGRVLTGSQGVDDLLRELRLAPLLQLGVSYSF